MSAAVTAGDLDGAMSLFEPTASFVQLAYVAEGSDAIRGAIRSLLSMKPRLVGIPDRVVTSGDVALVCGKWTLWGTGPDDNPLELAGRFTDVVRRQGDGRWLFVIDNPYGVD
jgi:ketosteroid isomerase-like protein